MNTSDRAWLEFAGQTRWRSCRSPKKRWRLATGVCQAPTRRPGVSSAYHRGCRAPPSASTSLSCRRGLFPKSRDPLCVSNDRGARARCSGYRQPGQSPPESVSRCVPDRDLFERRVPGPAWEEILCTEMTCRPSAACRNFPALLATARFRANRCRR